jgi:hypothetical protein
MPNQPAIPEEVVMGMTLEKTTGAAGKSDEFVMDFVGKKVRTAVQLGFVGEIILVLALSTVLPHCLSSSYFFGPVSDNSKRILICPSHHSRNG